MLETCRSKSLNYFQLFLFILISIIQSSSNNPKSKIQNPKLNYLYCGGFFLEILNIGKDELDEWGGKYNCFTGSSEFCKVGLCLIRNHLIIKAVPAVS